MKLISATTTMRALFVALAALLAFPVHAGEFRQISQIIDSSGNPVVNGYVYIGTYNLDPVTNPISLFSDSGLTVPIANPQRTDSYGRPVNDIYFSEAQYSYTLKDSAAVVIEGPKNRDAVPTAASVASNQAGTSTSCGTFGGTANALTCTLSPAITSYTNLMSVRGLIAIDNTLAVTLSINGLGARNVVKWDGAALAAGDLQANDTALLIFDTANNRFQLGSPNGAVNTTGAQTISGAKTVSGALTMSGAAFNAAQGADIASSGTINLDTMTGNDGQLTGSTTVTAVTLTNGRVRRLRATGAVPITAGASLVVNLVPSGATYTATVGDILIFEAIQSVVYVTVQPMASVARILCAGGNITAPVDATEDTLAACTIPGNALGANGQIRITADFRVTNNANAKTIRFRYSGGAGTVIMTQSAGSTTGWLVTGTLYNKNVTNAQTYFGTLSQRDGAAGAVSGSIGVGGINAQVTTQDTTASSSIVMTCQKATAGDTCVLDHYMLELLPSP